MDAGGQAFVVRKTDAVSAGSIEFVGRGEIPESIRRGAARDEGFSGMKAEREFRARGILASKVGGKAEREDRRRQDRFLSAGEGEDGFVGILSGMETGLDERWVLVEHDVQSAGVLQFEPVAGLLSGMEARRVQSQRQSKPLPGGDRVPIRRGGLYELSAVGGFPRYGLIVGTVRLRRRGGRADGPATAGRSDRDQSGAKDDSADALLRQPGESCRSCRTFLTKTFFSKGLSMTSWAPASRARWTASE